MSGTAEREKRLHNPVLAASSEVVIEFISQAAEALLLGDAFAAKFCALTVFSMQCVLQC